ncbi:MAG: adenylate/guanylate cyclase domain-containing protein, partial [Gammaproteobacteria bacterium]
AAKAMTNLAIAQGRLGHSTQALEFFERARARFVRENNRMWPALVDLYQSLLLMQEGSHLKARQLCESGIRRMRSQAANEREEFKRLLGRFVSPEIATEVLDRHGDVVLAGQERTATVLFTDIRNFTAITAGQPPNQVLSWLNKYFTAMSEVVKENGGFLNKFLGDGMLIVFGVPLSEGAEQDACRAVRAALQMLERVDEFNAQKAAQCPRIQLGIGIHTGRLTAGCVGSRDRLEYSVIGETVNLASRLQELNKHFKTSIILSPQTRELVEDNFETRALGETGVRGLPQRIRVFTVASKSAS